LSPESPRISIRGLYWISSFRKQVFYLLNFPAMKLVLIALTFFCLAATVGCEKDVREPGEPRIVFNAPR